jgi:peptidyl-prolyl cis-trans isomerase A (cyclophilin A)
MLPAMSFVVLETTEGAIVICVDLKNAPITARNFVSQVDQGVYDGGSFFRTVRSDMSNDVFPSIDVIQADCPAARRSSNTIPLERTSETGLSHVAGTISMARSEPDTASTSFFIVVETSRSLNFGGKRNPDGQGFAAFGNTVKGLDVVRRIYRSPLDSELLKSPAMIVSARFEAVHAKEV